jgi:hypothetical protein
VIALSTQAENIPLTLAADEIAADFFAVARLAGIDLPPGAIKVEKLPAPHLPPTKLPSGRMAVYVFAKGPEALKVGKVGAKSQARYTSQHYNPGRAMSTLAASNALWNWSSRSLTLILLKNSNRILFSTSKDET